MIHVQRERIEPGEITEHRGVMLCAVSRNKRISCSNCECKGQDFMLSDRRCSGFCYRWENGDALVFKRVTHLADVNEIVETNFAGEAIIV